MANNKCPVTESIHFIDDIISSGGLSHPRSRRIAEEIHSLLDDVAWGRAGDDHLPAVRELIKDLLEEKKEPQGQHLGQHLKKTLEDNLEVFESHVKTHNCPTENL